MNDLLLGESRDGWKKDEWIIQSRNKEKDHYRN